MNKGVGAAVLIGLHGGDALCRRQSSEGLHHEDREGEEDATDDTAADRGHGGQGGQRSFEHDARSPQRSHTPVAAVSRA